MKTLQALAALAGLSVLGHSVLGLAAFADEPPAPAEAKAVAPRAAAPQSDWIGTYASPSDVARYARVVLVVEEGWGDSLYYRMTPLWNDVIGGDEIKEEEKHGWILLDGDKLYLPIADGTYGANDKTPSLCAKINRYTRLKINGRTVLLSDNCRKLYQEKQELFAHGVLIKVDDAPSKFYDLHKVRRHEPLKILTAEPPRKKQDSSGDGPRKQ